MDILTTTFFGFLAASLAPADGTGLLNRLVAARLPIVAPTPALAAFGAQVVEANVVVSGLPVIVAPLAGYARPGEISLTRRGAYPGCLDAAVAAASRQAQAALSLAPGLNPTGVMVRVTLADGNDWPRTLASATRWFRVRAGHSPLEGGLDLSLADLVEVHSFLDAPTNSRFWVSLGTLWEVERAVLDLPDPQGGPRAQIGLLVRPESGEVLFPFFAVGDGGASVLWVEASPRVFGHVLPTRVYLRASTKDGVVRLERSPPAFWKLGAATGVPPLPKLSEPFTISR